MYTSPTTLFRSVIGEVSLGLLQLTGSPAIYNTLSVTAFVVTVNPGSAPDIPTNSTGAQITKLCYAFDTAAALLNEYDRTDKALRQILLTTVDKMYIHSLRHKYGVYGIISIPPSCTIYTQPMPTSPPRIYKKTTLSFRHHMTSINQLSLSSTG